MKGFKKSIFSFVTYLLFIIGFFLSVGPVVNFLWSYSNPQIGVLLGKMMPELTTATSVAQAVPLALQTLLPAEFADLFANPHLLSLVAGIGMFALKLVYALLYFTIIYLLYKLVCAILYGIFLKGRKGTDKYVSKNRFLGAVFGVLQAAVVLFVTLIIMGGVVAIIASMTTLVPSGEQEVRLDFPRPDIYQASQSLIVPAQAVEIPPELHEAVRILSDLVAAYDANIFIQAVGEITYNDSGTSVPLNIYLFDSVLSIDYVTSETETETISIRHELSVAATIAAYVFNMEFLETQEFSSITSDDVVAVFGMVSESDLLTTILPLGIELAAGYFEIPLDLPTEELYAINWKDEIDQLAVIAAIGIDIVNQAGLFNDELDLTQVTVDGDVVRDLFDALAESDLVNLPPLWPPAGPEMVGGKWKHRHIARRTHLADELRAMGNLLGAVLDTASRGRHPVGRLICPWYRPSRRSISVASGFQDHHERDHQRSRRPR